MVYILYHFFFLLTKNVNQYFLWMLANVAYIFFNYHILNYAKRNYTGFLFYFETKSSMCLIKSFMSNALLIIFWANF